ncbi:hypothetical protein AMTR_s00069p00179420 [Amborella trichopoda]|uniref:Peptidase S8/S53 domain-containing protein n=1 Tax=Amborella trichopoda TaxID=13333 RepID=U5DDE1_AMBTC|nr:hypothetical protein AMTR_s00069p00179420 [Amborella trichopoda]
MDSNWVWHWNHHRPLDSGIWPVHPSLNTAGMPPPPKKWNGKCFFDASYCTNKVIGTRAYNGGSPYSQLNPRDEIGHGTHTTTTAAGGLSPELRCLAMLRAQPLALLPGIDILAGFDQAVQDGVDVISVSLGGDRSEPFINDPLAMGAFLAMRKVDRVIRANTKLGNGDTFMGESGYQAKGFGPTPLPLV